MAYLRIKPVFHDYLHWIGFLAIAIGLPFTKILLSLGTMLLVLNLVLEGNFRSYLTFWKKSKIIWLVLGLFALEFIGLLWSSDLNYGLDDIRKKLPLLLIPLAFAARPLTKPQLLGVLKIFVLAMIVSSVWNYLYFFQRPAQPWSADIRSLSLFGSHIRYALMVVLAIIILIQFYLDKTLSRILVVISILWLIYYTYFSQVLSGYLALIALVMGFIHLLIKPHKTYLKIALISLPFVVFAFILFFASSVFTRPESRPSKSEFPSHTALGNPYFHDTTFLQKENGTYIFCCISDQELQEEWGKRSDIPYDSLDRKGHVLKQTIYRYLSYLGQPKDSAGLAELNKADIENIEKGLATPLHAESGWLARWADLKFQWNNRGNPNGHSLLQRIEYWKAGLHLIGENWLFGVGTGDPELEFQKYYTQIDSELLPEYRHRAHNTYMTQWLTFGVLGVVLLLVLLIQCFKVASANRSWLIFAGTWLFILTFFPEDTLETQSGVTLFAWFLTLVIARERVRGEE